MKYLNEQDISSMGISWDRIISAVEDCTRIMEGKDYSQPVKPYLRYHDQKNRIIAMPAFVGGNFQVAGIKWIASFPENIRKGIARAHSVVILNDAETGIPLAVINTALLSGIRTASVTGFVIEKYLCSQVDRQEKKFNCGIIGMGPIGQLHLRMLLQRFGEAIGAIHVYDINGVAPSLIEKYSGRNKVIVEDNWGDVFDNADIFITCTVSTRRYIDRAPRKGALYLNVSLRDFHPEFLRNVDQIVVDNWEEVCRENTDIELAHKEFGLQRADVLEIGDLLEDRKSAWRPGASVMFNPMGMAVYDVAVARYYYDYAVREQLGTDLS